MTSKVVNQVVDSLDVRVGQNRSASAWLLLSAVVWRTQFDEYEPGQAPTFYELDGLGTFTVQPGRRPYEFTLINQSICDIRVWNPEKWRTSRDTGQFYVSFRSSFLQFHGMEMVHKVLATLRKLMYGDSPTSVSPDGWNFTRVSGADLACDMQLSSNLTHKDLDDYVCLARTRDESSTPYVENTEDLLKRLSVRESRPSTPMDNKGGDVFILPPPGPAESAALALIKQFATGVDLARDFDAGSAVVSRSVTRRRQLYTCYFGKFGSAIFARLYNKLASLAVHGKEYMLDVWHLRGWDSESPVWRTEFSLSGDFLKGFKVVTEFGEPVEDLRDLDTFENHLHDIWHYLTHSWLRHCDDTHQVITTQWTTSDMWEQLQKAFSPSKSLLFERTHWTPPPEAHALQLRKQAQGVAVTSAALASKNLERPLEALGVVGQHLVAFLKSKDAELALEAKLKHYGWDSYTDTQLRSNYRAARMQQGLGS